MGKQVSLYLRDDLETLIRQLASRYQTTTSAVVADLVETGLACSGRGASARWEGIFPSEALERRVLYLLDRLAPATPGSRSAESRALYYAALWLGPARPLDEELAKATPLRKALARYRQRLRGGIDVGLDAAALVFLSDLDDSLSIRLVAEGPEDFESLDQLRFIRLEITGQTLIWRPGSRFYAVSFEPPRLSSQAASGIPLPPEAIYVMGLYDVARELASVDLGESGHLRPPQIVLRGLDREEPISLGNPPWAFDTLFAQWMQWGQDKQEVLSAIRSLRVELGSTWKSHPLGDWGEAEDMPLLERVRLAGLDPAEPVFWWFPRLLKGVRKVQMAQGEQDAPSYHPLLIPPFSEWVQRSAPWFKGLESEKLPELEEDLERQWLKSERTRASFLARLLS